MAKGFIFKCSNRSEAECFDRSLFGADKLVADEVLSLEPGDKLFLFNVDDDSLAGVYTAATHGGHRIVSNAWKGRYPYQIAIRTDKQTTQIHNAKETLRSVGINTHRILYDFEASLLEQFFNENGRSNSDNETLIKRIAKGIANTRKLKGISSADENKPPFESTTLWDYPKQSYGRTPKGNNKYAGVTPAFIIYNLVKRYTSPGDLVVDPMCGSGTTIDVCREEGRQVIGYDIVSTRPDIIENDARAIPLDDNSVDLVFIDSPYGDNIKYNDSPMSIGNISAESEDFYDELEKVMQEAHRILRPGKVLGWLIGDQWVKKRFTPVGFKVYERLTRYFEPIDVISVARRSQSSNTGVWHNRAIQFNFYLRGFKYLHIVRKSDGNNSDKPTKSIKWAYYERQGIASKPVPKGKKR